MLGSARAQEKNDLLDKALALQKITQKVIAQTEPAIACVLVSRSDDYRRRGQPPGPEETGRLGGFNPSTIVIRDENERARIIRKLDMSSPNYVPEAFGSGVVVDAKGLVLTNYHVVQGATKIFVRLPGQKGSYADIHAADSRSDLAVLRLHSPLGGLKPIAMGVAEKLERGEFVLSLANPFAAGFRDGQPSASWGILSNIRRRVPTQFKEEERVKPLHHYGVLLQTDARLHLGCSGGALLSLKGELIGLTTAMAAIQGGETPGGFALPMDAGFRRIIEVLKRGEEVEYGFLGVGPTPDQPRGRPGVLIARVTPGSPARLDAGLRENDTILAVGGIPVSDIDDLFLHIGSHLAGTKVQFEIRRDGATDVTKVEATLAKFLSPGKSIASTQGKRPYFKGLRVDYTSLLMQQTNLPRNHPGIPAGVLITDVQPDTIAAEALLKLGEVITHVNGQAVLNPVQFYQAVNGAQGKVELTLQTSPHEPATKVTLK